MANIMNFSQPTPASAPQHYKENTRNYHAFRRGMYLYPCDEDEKDRMDIYHKIFEVARRGQLHTAPIISSHNEPARIMDVGCGTGIWAIDIADRYPTAEVLGLDLVNIQPEKIPPQLRFRVPIDHEGPWTFGEESWDLIHIQQACGSISSWPELYQKAFAHLKPGSGYIEQVEIDLKPRCDDGTLLPDSPLHEWYNYLDDATNRANRPIAFNAATKEQLRAAGFIDIREQIIRAPLNGWPNDPHQRQIGRWYYIGLSEGLEALSAAPFTRIFRWDFTEHVLPLCGRVKKEMTNHKVHAYNNIHIITARKPL
ncbi:LaeA-like protein [Microthyrium microscopicum]|uniref:LaeA-like protein n=1 Tax=Microthyrium microscopicum TaxID=703497 RepID=A0A6A6U7J2_9PEZI|nr:LaeA-like protein [Microthyrium microscopicum]